MIYVSILLIFLSVCISGGIAMYHQERFRVQQSHAHLSSLEDRQQEIRAYLSNCCGCKSL